MFGVKRDWLVMCVCVCVDVWLDLALEPVNSASQTDIDASKGPGGSMNAMVDPEGFHRFPRQPFLGQSIQLTVWPFGSSVCS